MEEEDEVFMIPGERKVKPGVSDETFGSNKITTSKYRLSLFIPLNLYYQFTKAANVYFLLLMVLQTIKSISLTNGVPLLGVSLLVVVGASMLKDFVEDRRRRLSDREENTRKVRSWKGSSFVTCTWEQLCVGDIILISCDELFPADVLLLASAENAKGRVFVETKSLDGETNLKAKTVPASLNALGGEELILQLLETQGNVICEAPNDRLYQFNGRWLLSDGSKCSLDHNHIALRGSTLRSTDHVIALVVYTGAETKAMLNSTKSQEKKSILERQTDLFICVIFVFLAGFCLFAGGMYIAWLKINREDIGYLELEDENLATVFLVRLGNWMLIFGNFVPISLLITLETVKLCQGALIARDAELTSLGQPCKVQSSNLNEELGQIQYVFADKTGTLTKNQMIFKRLVLDDEIFGSSVPTSPEQSGRVDFDDPEFEAKLGSESAQQLLRLLATCHTVVVDEKGYSATSPDELALIEFPRKFGCEYKAGEAGAFYLCEENSVAKFRLLHVFEFSSDRKRMSVIVRAENGRILLLCKGADNVLIPRCRNVSSRFKAHLQRFAEEGLRTLVLAQREITSAELETFDRQLLMNPADHSTLQDGLESRLELVGATGVEDKLQDAVGPTLSAMRNAGIKVWVLTGDKLETARNIGFAAQLLTKDMHLVELVSWNGRDALLRQLYRLQTDIITSKKPYAALVNAEVLYEITALKLEKKLLFALAAAESVIFCRMSPRQKQDIVALVRENMPSVHTLAIGDGANDVGMITRAHVGVGISGVEGFQASRAADYSVSEFRHLKRLLFVHGRESYRKNCVAVLYTFWKNVLVVLPQFWYAVIYGNYSGMSIYDNYLYLLVNLVYTALPIIVYAVLDVEIDAQTLEAAPLYYRISLQRLHFNLSVFLMWFGVGVTQSLLIALLSGLVNADPTSLGEYLGFWGYGTIVFSMTQIIANLKVFIFSNSVSAMSIASSLLSLSLFFTSLLIIDGLIFNRFYGVAAAVFSAPTFYISATLMIICCTFLDYIWHMVQKILFYKSINIINRYEMLNGEEKVVFEAELERRVSMARVKTIEDASTQRPLTSSVHELMMEINRSYKFDDRDGPG